MDKQKLLNWLRNEIDEGHNTLARKQSFMVVVQRVEAGHFDLERKSESHDQ